MGAMLIEAKPDRLPRDSAFVLTIRRAGVAIEFCDVPASKALRRRSLVFWRRHPEGRLGAAASLQAVAREMDAIGASTSRDGRWTATVVRKALERLAKVA